jgi:transposase
LGAANRPDGEHLIPLIDAIPPLAGRRGRPRCRPDAAQGDRAYHSKARVAALRQRRIEPIMAPRGSPHGSGWGATRWPIERTLAWLHQFRRLRVRYDRRADIHEAFLTLGCALICWRTFLRRLC